MTEHLRFLLEFLKFSFPPLFFQPPALSLTQIPQRPPPPHPPKPFALIAITSFCHIPPTSPPPPALDPTSVALVPRRSAVPVDFMTGALRSGTNRVSSLPGGDMAGALRSGNVRGGTPKTTPRSILKGSSKRRGTTTLSVPHFMSFNRLDLCLACGFGSKRT
jgi:hypothetical protein